MVVKKKATLHEAVDEIARVSTPERKRGWLGGKSGRQLALVRVACAAVSDNSSRRLAKHISPDNRN